VEEDGAAVFQRAAGAGRAVDVGRHANAVAHGEHDVLGEVDIELRARGAGGGVEGLHAGPG
jgi:hypothetical protein